MNQDVKVYKTPDLLVADLSRRLKGMIENAHSKKIPFNILLPGGKTPEILFEYLGNQYSNEIKWEHVHFFWIDERCVPSDHPESNFGNANRLMFRKLKLPLSHIHPIVGENHPYLEADRYSTLIHKHFNIFSDLPVFDLILLGVGSDGHIASIFPNQMGLFHSNRLYEVATHPETGQQRITATGKVINNAAHIIFIATGEAKASIIKQVFNDTEAQKLPASLVAPKLGNVEWFLDQQAASQIKTRQ